MMFPPYFFPLLSAGNKHTYKTHVIKPTKRSMSPDSNCSFIEDTSVLSSKTSTIDKLIDNKGEKTNPKKITGTLKAIKNLKKRKNNHKEVSMYDQRTSFIQKGLAR